MNKELHDKFSALLESVDPKKEIFSTEAISSFVALIESRVAPITAQLSEAKSELANVKIKLEENENLACQKLDELIESYEKKITSQDEEEDDEACGKLKKVVESLTATFEAEKKKLEDELDESAVNGLNTVVEALNSSYIKKLQEAIELVEARKDAEKETEKELIKKTVVEQTSNYIKTQLGNLVNEQITIVNQKHLSESKKSEDKIKELTKQLNEQKQKVTKLVESNNKLEAQVMLESTTALMTTAKREFIMNHCKTAATKSEVNSLLNEAITAYETRTESIKTVLLEESAKNNSYQSNTVQHTDNSANVYVAAYNKLNLK